MSKRLRDRTKKKANQRNRIRRELAGLSLDREPIVVAQRLGRRKVLPVAHAQLEQIGCVAGLEDPKHDIA